MAINLEGNLFIEPYIVDFACIEKKLIVELDGGQHLLKKKGYKVLRFWNDDVLLKIENITENIYSIIEK